MATEPMVAARARGGIHAASRGRYAPAGARAGTGRT
jgi:hypothetical protein